MKIPWGFVISRVLQDILKEPFTFAATVLCATLVCFTCPIVMGGKNVLACLMPPWANRAAAMISWNAKASEKDRKKVIEIIQNSKWYETLREVPGEEVAKEVEMLAKSFGKESFLADPSTMPGYLEITLSRHCLEEPQKCQAFMDELASNAAVDSVFSGVALASETKLWFERIRRFFIILTVLFLFVMVTMVFLLTRISFYRRMREIYLWDLLGASPLFKRLACYTQAVSIIVLAWPLSLLALLYSKRYLKHLEHFFGTNQSCSLSVETLLGSSIVTLFVVASFILIMAEWAFRKSWNLSIKMDWTWTD
ncbi:MAG: hypothetical protein N2260_03615 [Syntrophobacterales bacterium]|nr:hypothetical protein [Syntrophobacterales bacterium]